MSEQKDDMPKWPTVIPFMYLSLTLSSKQHRQIDQTDIHTDKDSYTGRQSDTVMTNRRAGSDDV